MKPTSRVALLILALGFIGTSSATTLSDIVSTVSSSSYSNWHTALFTSDGNSRGFTYPGAVRSPAHQHDLARDFIATHFQSMGFNTWLDPFTFTHPDDGSLYTNCNNVVAIKPGTGGTNIFIIGAHYDSVDPADNISVTLCPGADDNASGVAALLETAQAIQNFTFRDTIILIAFDAEEKTFQGALHFVADHITTDPAQTNATIFLQSRIQGMMSVDTIAYDDPTTPREVIIGSMGNTLNSPISLGLAQAATNYTTLIPLRDNGWTGSDHNPFFQVGIQTVLLIESDFFDYNNEPNPTFKNPYNHVVGDSTDTPNYIDYAYATEITQCIVGYLCEQARAVPPATLHSALEADLFTINWNATPGVAYTLYGTQALSHTNIWTALNAFGSAPTSSILSVSLSTQTNPHQSFKVESL